MFHTSFAVDASAISSCLCPKNFEIRQRPHTDCSIQFSFARNWSYRKWCRRNARGALRVAIDSSPGSTVIPCETPEVLELPLNCPNSLSDLSPESTASLRGRDISRGIAEDGPSVERTAACVKAAIVETAIVKVGLVFVPKKGGDRFAGNLIVKVLTALVDASRGGRRIGIQRDEHP